MTELEYSVLLSQTQSKYLMDISRRKICQPEKVGRFAFSIALMFFISAQALRANIVAWGTNTLSTSVVPNVTAGKSIAAGYWHNLVIKSTNSVVAWGLNDYGQTNVPAGLKAIAVAAGRDHSLALKTNGVVVGWGINSSYSGDPDYFGQADVPAGLSNVVAIAAGGFHSAALVSNGTVVCWGYNFYGQTNVPADLTNAIAIACGNAFSLALRSDGTVEGWGDDFYGQIDIPTDLTNVVAIAAGGFHGLALKTDGTVEGWGYDFYGQADPPLDLTNAVAIAAGYTHSLALRSDGAVTAWGDDAYGQITGQTNRISTLSRVVAIAGGYGHNLALTNDSPFILVQPVSVITNAGVTVRFSVFAVGSGLISFNTKWWFSGTNTFIGTGSTLTLNNVNTNSIGSYFVTVSNTVNTVTSAVVRLTLVDAGSPVIVTNPVGKTINVGSNATFFVSAIGAPPLNYQWWLTQTNSGQTDATANPITDATNNLYAISNAQATNAGNYFAIVSNALG
ncbi:MAG TPA: immunoglobulin domain-containing protein, partial [Verrucomicrobiae bacterium]